MDPNEKNILSHLKQFAGTSRHNPAILDASLVGDGLRELASEGLLVVRTDTGEAWITQDGWRPWNSRLPPTRRPAGWNGSSARLWTGSCSARTRWPK